MRPSIHSRARFRCSLSLAALHEREMDTREGTSEEQEEQLTREHVAAISSPHEVQMRSEGVDAEWAEAAEWGMVAGISEGDIAGVALKNVQCRSSLCRLTLQFDDTETRNDEITTLVGRVPRMECAFSMRSMTTSSPSSCTPHARAGICQCRDGGRAACPRKRRRGP